MNHLISLAQNNLYSKVKDEEGKETYKKFIELIFLVDKPSFIYTNEGEVVRTRNIERFSMVVSEAVLDRMILQLTDMKKGDDSDLS